MKHSKGGPRAVLGEDYTMTFPKLIRRRAERSIPFEYKLAIITAALFILGVPLKLSGVFDRLLGL